MRPRRPGGRFAALSVALTLAGCDDQGGRSGTEVPLTGDSAVRARQATDWDAPVDPGSFPGLEHPPWPEGVEHLAGSLVRDRRGPAGEASWVFSHVRAGGRPMLWLARVVSRDTLPLVQDGRQVGVEIRPIFRVVDAVAVPRIEPEERLDLGTCRTPDSTHVAAVVRWRTDRAVLDEVRIAWRVEPSSGSLIPTDPAPVRCRNRGYGAR